MTDFSALDSVSHEKNIPLENVELVGTSVSWGLIWQEGKKQCEKKNIFRCRGGGILQKLIVKGRGQMTSAFFVSPKDTTIIHLLQKCRTKRLKTEGFRRNKSETF